MVAVESTFEIPQEEIYLVSQRKYNLDPSRPWWQKVYFRYVFLPFIRFSFKKPFNIPAVGAIEPDGRIVIIEQQKVCVTEQSAEAACKVHDEFWSWKPLPVEVELPRGSVQYKGHRNPLSVLPDRYRRRTYPVATAPIHQMKQIKRNLEKAIESAAITQ